LPDQKFSSQIAFQLRGHGGSLVSSMIALSSYFDELTRVHA